MKLRFASGLILLAASAFAQQLPSTLTSHFKANTGMTKRQMIQSIIKEQKFPKLQGAEYFFVVPQVADGLQAGQGVWTTAFQISNLDPENAGAFELDFYNQDGTTATVGITGLGSVSSITGNLAAGQTVSYVTSGLPSTTQIAWAEINTDTSGAFVNVYPTINLYNSSANYLSSMSGPSDFGVINSSTEPGALLAFNNVNGAATSAAFANPDFTNYYDVNTLQITFIDSSGNVIGSPVTYTVNPGNQTAVVIANQWPQTANMTGSMYIIPYSTGCTTACPSFSPITILAIQGTYTQNAQGFSHTNAFAPLQTIGDY